MRALLVFCILFASLGAVAQEPLLFLKVRTDVAIIVRKHPLGADMVDITMRDPNYPKELLTSQVEEMCRLLGTPARGLAVTVQSVAPGAQFTFVKANFATNGIILANGDLHIEPILKAFAGAPAPYTIQGISLAFPGFVPSKKTLQRYDQPGMMEAEGRYTDQPAALKGLEYRVQLLTQDPSKISFPDEYGQSEAAATVPRASENSSRTWLFAIVIVAAIAVGALVYFAMLRAGARARA